MQGCSAVELCLAVLYQNCSGRECHVGKALRWLTFAISIQIGIETSSAAPSVLQQD